MGFVFSVRDNGNSHTTSRVKGGMSVGVPIGLEDRSRPGGGNQDRRSWCSFTTPAGWVAVEMAAERVVRVCLGVKAADGGPLPAVVVPLAAYLRGEVPVLPGIPWWLEGGTAFQQAVWRALGSIPAGVTWSYGDVAAHLGRPGAARVVGRALSRNPLPVLLPCHRVIAATGLGGFSCGLAWKRYLLGLEGGKVGSGGVPVYR